MYVSNLSFNIEDDDLRGFFEEYGEVASAKVIIDKLTQRSKGFGFVEMSDNAAAAKAMAEVNGSVADGRTIRGSRAVRVDSPFPKLRAPETATAVIR